MGARQHPVVVPNPRHRAEIGSVALQVADLLGFFTPNIP